MKQLTCENGVHCGDIIVIQLDGQTWATVVTWKKGVDSLPSERFFFETMESSIKECREKGALYVDSRIITMTEGVDEALTTERAAIHRQSLTMFGFKRGEDRVEYKMNLADALAALGARKRTADLVWNCVNTDNESDLAQAASLFQQASEGDPASHSDDDAMGFLTALIEDKESVQAPERLQIGICGNDPAAVLALKAYESDGWSSIYYLGVLPAFRRRGFGAAAMLQGLNSLKVMGGKIYHDGTGAENAAARALFSHVGHSPFRAMEEWRLTN